MKKILIVLSLMVTFPNLLLADVVFRSEANVGVSVAATESAVVHTALDIFAKDYKAVFGGRLLKDNNGQIVIGTVGNNSAAEKMIDAKLIQQLRQHAEGYAIQAKGNKIYILGSDKRGTAYGILELSRKIGVSPWEWWADSDIEKKTSFKLANGFSEFKYPSVAHRGIFLNDEDFGLTPWSYLTHEPSTIKGQIGPKTHARIFELLLRLRANMFWPAMHECSVAFYLTEGNREMADKYGIILGASHCEPMMRNTNAEWKIAGTGAYDWVNNRENVLKFWEERVAELKNSDNVYTIGIRGVHDGKMQGANTLQEQKEALTGIFKDQREMIAKHLDPDVEKVPQVFIPYKEVLDVYNMGLQVPEDVTLMWTDDNYGYIRHFPNVQERQRKGGNGVYYHLSYWGRPHDYLWLATNHPAQIYTQMKMAYDKGAKEMWVVNVGDIKPGEYLIELFLDMAWDINSIANNQQGLDQHLRNWLAREFGEKHASTLLGIMNEYYRLAYIRKPEFMGNTRTEETDPKYKIVSDLNWSNAYVKTRIQDYERIANQVVTLSKSIPFAKQDTWFELIEYPVRAAAEMNKKHLYGQLARHGETDWKSSDYAFLTIETLTQKYNNLRSGKWNKIMSHQPRKLAAFDKVPQEKADAPFPNPPVAIRSKNGNEFSKFEGERPVGHGLGYQRGAVTVKKNTTVEYVFNVQAAAVTVEVALAPNHPVDGKKISYEISVDGTSPKQVAYQTVDRNEEWKKNVTTNQAIRKHSYQLVKPKQGNLHTVKIKAMDEGVIIDQIHIYTQ